MLLAGFMALGVSVKAMADARLDSMATDARLVEDSDLIWLYPNKVLDYKNMVDFRLGPYNDLPNENTNEWGGLLLQIDPSFGVLGLYVNRAGDEDTVNYSLWNSGSVRPFLRYTNNRVGNVPWYMNYTGFPNSSLDLFWANNVGGADLGVHVNYSEALTSGENWGLGVGLGLTGVGPFDKLNLHADYDKEWWSGAGQTDQGIYTMKLGALGTSPLNSDNDLRVFADLQMDGYKIDYYTVDYSDWGLDLGASINHKISGGKGFVSTGLILDYLNGSSPSASFDFNIVNWDLFWNASIEAPVADWLTLRSGLSKLLVARVYDRNDSYGNGVYYDNDGNNVQLSTGFAINWQNFTLDCNLDTSTLESSISNVQPGRGIFFSNGNIVTVTSADLRYKF